MLLLDSTASTAAAAGASAAVLLGLLGWVCTALVATIGGLISGVIGGAVWVVCACGALGRSHVRCIRVCALRCVAALGTGRQFQRLG